ncbi:MAG TPA: hypothetical protein DCY07_03225 [Rhodospirillaceae bacterium]|nr:hypothetical protein [Rhodospirillaceae bacterium]
MKTKNLSPIEISRQLEDAWLTLQEGTDGDALWKKLVKTNKPLLAQNDIFSMRFLIASIESPIDNAFGYVSAALLRDVNRRENPSHFEQLAKTRLSQYYDVEEGLDHTRLAVKENSVKARKFLGKLKRRLDWNKRMQLQKHLTPR